MKNATMLYKAPGPHEIHGGHFDYTIVDADEEGAIEQAQADGWHLTTPEAKADYDAVKAPEVKLPPNDLLGPTRAELEQKANELKLKFSAKTTDEELGKLIQAKLGS